MRYYYHIQMQLKHYIYIYISVSAKQPFPHLYYYGQFTAKVSKFLQLMSCIFKHLQASECLFILYFTHPVLAKLVQ